MKICALICAYNEENSAAEVIGNTLNYVDKIIFVNDGSKDNTLEFVKSKFSGNKKVTILSWDKNRGKGYALIQGFKKFLASNCDLVVTVDADGQHDPQQIALVSLPITSKKIDLVVGSRIYPEVASPRMRVLFNIISSIAVLLTSGGFHSDVASGFRAYTREAIRKILPFLKIEDYAIELEILTAASLNKLRIASVPVTCNYDVGKKENFGKISKSYLRFAWKYKKEIIERVLRI